MVQTHQPLGGAKVGDLELAGVHVDEHVVSLDVSVDDLLVVEVLESLHHLAGVVLDGGFVVLQGTPLVLQEGGEAT